MAELCLGEVRARFAPLQWTIEEGSGPLGRFRAEKRYPAQEIQAAELDKLVERIESYEAHLASRKPSAPNATGKVQVVVKGG